MVESVYICSQTQISTAQTFLNALTLSHYISLKTNEHWVVYMYLFSLIDAGQNEGRPLHVSHNSVIGYVINVDEEGKETDLIGIIGMRHPLWLS